MATIRSINMENDEVMLTAAISNDENKSMKGARDIIILPCEFDEELTTGKLGNSNRIMLPKKILKEHNIELKGKVPAKAFVMNGKKFLLIKLDEKVAGVPKFKE